VRNAHERNRRRERAVASLGKCYSFANSQPDAKSVADCFVNSVRNTISVTIGDICISPFQPRSAWFDLPPGKFTFSKWKSSQ
jgi:hypothetical protein